MRVMYILESDDRPGVYIRSCDIDYTETKDKAEAKRFPTEAAAIVAAEDSETPGWVPVAVKA